FDIVGAIVTDGGDVIINQRNNRMDVRASGSIITNGGDVSLTLLTNHHLYADGKIDTRSGTGNGDVTITGPSNINMRDGSQIYGGVVTFNSGNIVVQSAGAMIDADKLEGTVDKTVSLIGTNN